MSFTLPPYLHTLSRVLLIDTFVVFLTALLLRGRNTQYSANVIATIADIIYYALKK